MAAVCVFCCSQLEIVDSSDSDEVKVEESEKEEILKTFSKVVRSHFGLNITNLMGGQEGVGGDFLEDIMKVCLNCEQSFKLICQLYRELEGLRLKLEWEFGELIGKVEAVGRTPSKLKWLREYQQAEDFERMTNFRNNFILNGNQSLEKSKPTVILQRAQFQLNELLMKETIKIEQDDNDELLDYFSDDVGEDIDDEKLVLEQIEEKYSPLEELRQGSTSPVNHSDSDNYEDKMTAKSRLSIRKPFKCPHCPSKYTEQRNLLRHQRTRHANIPGYRKIKRQIAKPFKCPYCTCKYSKLNNLRRHQRSHHAKLYQNDKKLAAATKTEPSPFKKVNHVKKKTSRRSRKLPIATPFKCPHCPAKYSLRNNLRRHQRISHADLDVDTDLGENDKDISTATKLEPPSVPQVINDAHNPTNSEPIKPTTNKLPTTKPFKCPHCPAKYIHHKTLLRHHKTRHANLPEDFCPQIGHKCAHDNCTATFLTSFQLKRHILQVHGDDLDKDKISNTTCPICSKVCTQHCNLKYHMRTQHNDESPDLPLACDVPHCPKRFPNEDILKWHRMYYYHPKKDRRPLEIFKCPECHKDIHGPGAFKKHQRKHQRPEAPWICELCGAAFKSKAILKHHGLFHKGPDNWAFQCEECGKKCGTKHRLAEHMQVHSTVKKYSCPACGKGINCRAKLRNHINKFHAHEGFKDIPRKKKQPKLISRRVPPPPPTQPD